GFFSLGMPLFMGAGSVALAALIGKDLSGLDPAIARLANLALNLLHAVHSMEPLRRLLAARLNPSAIASSGVKLRLGITDLGTGQFFTVSEPDRSLGDDLLSCGTVECEPDHQLGASWLTAPIYGADAYLLPLDHAVFASSTLPVFMDPLHFDLA